MYICLCFLPLTYFKISILFLFLLIVILVYVPYHIILVPHVQYSDSAIPYVTLCLSWQVYFLISISCSTHLPHPQNKHLEAENNWIYYSGTTFFSVGRDKGAHK